MWNSCYQRLPNSITLGSSLRRRRSSIQVLSLKISVVGVLSITHCCVVASRLIVVFLSAGGGSPRRVATGIVEAVASYGTMKPNSGTSYRSVSKCSSLIATWIVPNRQHFGSERLAPTSPRSDRETSWADRLRVSASPSDFFPGLSLRFAHFARAGFGKSSRATRRPARDRHVGRRKTRWWTSASPRSDP